MNPSINCNENGLGAALGQLSGHKVLVFGGSGLIGQALTPKINCLAPSSKDCDVRDFTAVNSLIKQERPTLVINLAGESNPANCGLQASYELNVNSVTNICYSLASYCKGAKLFQAGSINQILSPASDYSRQKIKAESVANSYSGVLDVVNARLCTVEGEARSGFVVSDMVKWAKAYLATGKGFKMNDMGARKWMLDRDTAANCIIEHLATGGTGNFYFGPAVSLSIDEIFCEICYQLGLSVVKNGKSWVDVESGRIIATSVAYSNLPTPDFGARACPEAAKCNLSRVINSIILSS